MKNKIVGFFVCTLLIITTVQTVCTANIQTTRYVNNNFYFEPSSGFLTNSQGLITIKIVAKVVYIDDRHNLLGGAVNDGDIIEGKYTYDPTTPDTNSAPTVGDYYHTSSSCGIEVKAGGFVFKTDPSDVNFLVEIANDHGSPSPSDNYLLISYNNLPLSDEILVDYILWQLDDDTCTALSSTDLPTTAPVLADWESIFGLTLSGSDPSDPYKTYLIRAHVTKATKNKARNTDSVESDWTVLEVTGPKYKPLNINFYLLNWFFERFPNAISILR